MEAEEEEEGEEENSFSLDLDETSPHDFHLAFNRPRFDVLQVDNSARTLEKVKQTLQVKIQFQDSVSFIHSSICKNVLQI